MLAYDIGQRCKANYGKPAKRCQHHRENICADQECQCNYIHRYCPIKPIQQYIKEMNNQLKKNNFKMENNLPKVEKEKEKVEQKDNIRPFNSSGSGKLLVLRERQELRHELFYDLSEEIEEVCLYKCSSNQWRWIFQEIQLLPRVRHLTLEMYYYPNDIFKLIGQRMLQLTSLRTCFLSPNQQALNSLKNLKNLEHLQLGYSRIEERACRPIAQLEHINKLNLIGIKSYKSFQNIVTNKKYNLLFINISLNQFYQNQIDKAKKLLSEKDPKAILINDSESNGAAEEERLMERERFKKNL